MACGAQKISREQFDALWAEAEAEEAKRAADMPTERDAINAMWQAYQRLRELGWNDAIYCPKDGTEFDAIEPGSTGVHRCHYTGEWPGGHWWVVDDHGVWPSRPILYRVSEEEKARWKVAGNRLREMVAAASVDTLPKGQDREDGLGACKGSAVPAGEQGDAQPPSQGTPK